MLNQYDKEAFIGLLKRRGIRQEAVLDAMSVVPRKNFVELRLQEFGYEDSPLAAGFLAPDSC